jgi:MFS family permease
MWELYALWTWLPAFLQAAPNGPERPSSAGITMFLAMGVAGMIGCLLGGWGADRFGRRPAAVAALAVSGACCLLSPLAFHASPTPLFLLRSGAPPSSLTLGFSSRPRSALKISASSLACLACSEAQNSLVSIQSQSRGDTYALQFLGSFLLSSLVRYRPQIWQNALSRSIIRPRGRCHRARR